MEKQKRRKHSNFIVQGSILAIASIIVRLIGIAYRIPLTNIIGDEGNGYYAIAYEIYSILLLLSSYSLPLAVSKLVASRVASGERKNAYRIFKGALEFAILVGGIFALITYFTADFITIKIMIQPMSSIALKVLAPTLFIVAVMGVLRGYFQGLGTMMPTAVSQIVEGILNAVISIVAAYYLYSFGKNIDGVLKTSSYGAAYGAAGATLGTGAGALFGLLFLIIIFFAYKRILDKQIRRDRSNYTEPYKQIYKVLLLTIAPVILSTAIYNISGILDQILYNNILSGQGYSSKEAARLWGVYTSKYKLLINVPIAIASAIASSVIPSLITTVTEGDHKGTIRKIDTSIRFTMMVALPSAAGLTALASPILILLFGDGSALPARLLQVGSVSVVFFCLSTLTNGILQGIDKMKIPVRHASISLLIHLAFLFILLKFFKLHVYGVVYANIAFAFLICILNGMSLKKYLGYKQEILRTFLIPLIASIMMGMSVFLIHRGILMITDNNTISTGLAISCGVFIYIALLLVLRGIREDEILTMPKGKSLLKILKKLHLL